MTISSTGVSKLVEAVVFVDCFPRWRLVWLATITCSCSCDSLWLLWLLWFVAVNKFVFVVWFWFWLWLFWLFELLRLFVLLLLVFDLLVNTNGMSSIQSITTVSFFLTSSEFKSFIGRSLKMIWLNSIYSDHWSMLEIYIYIQLKNTDVMKFQLFFSSFFLSKLKFRSFLFDLYLYLYTVGLKTRTKI